MRNRVTLLIELIKLHLQRKNIPLITDIELYKQARALLEIRLEIRDLIDHALNLYRLKEKGDRPNTVENRVYHATIEDWIDKDREMILSIINENYA